MQLAVCYFITTTSCLFPGNTKYLQLEFISNNVNFVFVLNVSQSKRICSDRLINIKLISYENILRMIDKSIGL